MDAQTKEFYGRLHNGAAYELDVASVLLRLGCEVFTPAMGASEIDLVAVTPSGAVARIQVKAATHPGKNGGRWRIKVAREKRKSGRVAPYTRIDFFVGCRDGMYWVFPARECPGTGRRCGAESPFLNAWHLIVGLPAPEVEKPQLELLRDEAV